MSLLMAYYLTASYYEWASGGGASPEFEGNTDVDIDADESELLDEGDVGESACDECVSMDGFYDEKPERPHDGCDCQIVQHLNLDIDWEEVIENPQVHDEGLNEELLERVTIENDGTEPIEGSYSESHTVEGSIEVSATIEEVFEVSGSYSESITQEITFNYTVPGHSQGEIEVYGRTKTVTFEGDLYMLDPDSGDKVFVEHVSETIEAAYDVYAHWTSDEEDMEIEGD